MRLSVLTAFTAAWLTAATAASAQSSDRIAADGGDVIITPILHSSVQIEHAGTVVHIDPWTAGDLSAAKPADLILVTDDPAHHLDPAAIEQLRKPGAPVVLTATAHARPRRGRSARERSAGGVRRRAGGGGPRLRHDAGAALAPQGRGERLRRHPGRAAALLLRGGRLRRHPGRAAALLLRVWASACPRYRPLEGIDVAFMPMNLPVDRMRPIPVAECVKTFGPSVVYLIHYDNATARWFGDSRPAPSRQRGGDRGDDSGPAGRPRGRTPSRCATATGTRPGRPRRSMRCEGYSGRRARRGALAARGETPRCTESGEAPA